MDMSRWTFPGGYSQVVFSLVVLGYFASLESFAGPSLVLAPWPPLLAAVTVKHPKPAIITVDPRVAKCHRYGRYICVNILEVWGKK